MYHRVHIKRVPIRLLCRLDVASSRARGTKQAQWEHGLTIAIIDFELENGYDILTIGNGKEATAGSKMVVLSGFVKLRRIIIMASDAWLQMTSDSSGSATGFLFNVEQVTDIEGNSSLSLKT